MNRLLGALGALAAGALLLPGEAAAQHRGFGGPGLFECIAALGIEPTEIPEPYISWK